MAENHDTRASFVWGGGDAISALFLYSLATILLATAHTFLPHVPSTRTIPHYSVEGHPCPLGIRRFSFHSALPSHHVRYSFFFVLLAGNYFEQLPLIVQLAFSQLPSKEELHRKGTVSPFHGAPPSFSSECGQYCKT